jgi:serine/threonine protein kinase
MTATVEEIKALLRHPGIVQHVSHGVTRAGEPYLAMEWIDGVEKLRTPGRYGDMGIGGYCALLDGIQKAGLKERFDFDFLTNILVKQVNDTIERDTSKWVYYGVRPSNYINSPDSPYYKDNEDIVQKELEFLIDTRPQNGIWPIPWNWFENNEKYAKEFAISENWWRGIKGTEKMLLLKNFGRLP